MYQSQPKCLYVIVAREISTDSNDGMNSIIKIIDQFNVELDSVEIKKKGLTIGEHPILTPIKYCIATSWYTGEKNAEDTELKASINLIDPSGKDLGGPSQQAVLPANKDKVNLNFIIEGLPITTAGKYQVKATLTIGKKSINESYPVDINITQADRK